MISVLIPTYKRLPFLKRAVSSVFSQTYVDWELVISDDEADEGETWQWLKELSAHNSKVRIIKNAGPKHGQVYNVNNGLRECRGDWIKILFDDDGILPDCLSKMMRVVDRTTSAVMIGCRAQQWRNGVYCGDEKNYASSSCDLIRSPDCRLAILKFDRWNGRTPTHMLMRRTVVDRNVLMLDEGGLRLAVDWTWFARILDHGDYAMMGDVLVQQREGEVSSLTGEVRDDAACLDRELSVAYKLILDGMSAHLQRRISYANVKAELNGIRGIYHLRCRRYSLGLKMIMKSLANWKGPLLTLRWLLQETFPGRFSATKRMAIEL